MSWYMIPIPLIDLLLHLKYILLGNFWKPCNDQMNFDLRLKFVLWKVFVGSPGLAEHLIMAFNFDSPTSLPDLMDFNHQIWSLNENQLSGSARDAPLAASSLSNLESHLNKISIEHLGLVRKMNVRMRKLDIMTMGQSVIVLLAKSG